MNTSLLADLQHVLVRMIVPMRREFDCVLDVNRMRSNFEYAQTIVAQALTSRVQSLREHARLIDHRLRAAKTAQTPPPPPATDVRRRAAWAARHLIDLIGPMGEPLAIRMERATDTPSLAHLISEARACIASVRGEAAASSYARRALPANQPLTTEVAEP